MPGHHGWEIDQLIHLRRRRHEALTGDPPLRLRSVIDESLLARVTGGHAGETFLDSPKDLDAYRQVLADLRRAALDRAASRARDHVLSRRSPGRRDRRRERRPRVSKNGTSVSFCSPIVTRRPTEG